LARQALREAGVVRPFELRDLVLLAPLPVADGGDVRVRATLTPTDHGYSLDIRYAADGPSVDTDAGGTTPATSWVRTAQAQIMLRPVPPMAAVDVAAAVAACGRRGPLRGRQQDHLRFGPRWQVASRVHHGDGCIVAELHTAADGEQPAAYALDPALLDIGLCAALEVVPGYSADRLWVPLSIASLVVHTTQPMVDSTVIAQVVAGSSEQAGFATFDVRFVAADGTVQLTADGFTMKRLDGPLEVGPEPGDTVADHGAGQARRVSRAELVFRHNVEQGITAAEGATAFRRALTHSSGSRLLISSLDLDGLQRQMDAVSALSLRTGRSDATVGFARPQMDADFVAPRDATEAMLATLWQELLGIEQIGVHDSFFDLGGHSLIAVRLFARIRKLFSVDLPISALFTAPTIEAGAALIRSLVPEGDGTPAPSLPSHYTHLVPMHPRDNGTTTPFFLVAGMFGNVLNLRHLANQIGSDRPFYGLQARGLFGGSLPHETFEEMAAAYLAEVREVQPHGPYLLGGFSGGGVTALEMARQLLAEGEEVALLALLDTPAPAIKQPLRPLDRVVIQWQNLRRDGFRYVSTWWRNRRAWQHEVATKRDATTHDDARLHNVEIEQAFYRALSRYEMRCYPGTITLYRPPQAVHYRLPGGRLIDNGRNFVLDDNGWTGHCARLDLVKVPGDHDSMVLEPHVRVLAGHLRHAIDAAEAAAVAAS
ncbi:MAG: thioesterase domain-containing protein, partial [Ilumatobacteraceae bacterium]